uniref:Protein archease n=1 Tax=Candidatus Methanophaga sp. ANME-1 ERB7 TaxID=2759913 RepID=A0A7G9Z677_9EURY|nr:protein archease [Methanosarcinales archaeon ANME-1 ERB7]
MNREEKIKYIEHPSDVGFEVYGDTLEELYANAAIAMYSLMTDIDEIEADVERAIELKAEDFQSLMFDWLDELIFLFDSESLVMKKFDIAVNENNFSICGNCKGGKYDPSTHVSGIIIKAVTYNMMQIKKNEIWKARVVLDV